MNPRDLLASCLAWSGLVSIQLAEAAIATARAALQSAENAIPVACERLSAVTARLRTTPFEHLSESVESKSAPNGVRARSAAA